MLPGIPGVASGVYLQELCPLQATRITRSSSRDILDPLIMDFPHEGESIYYRFQASYTRDWFRDLLYCTGPDANLIEENWDAIGSSLDTQKHTAIDQPEFHHIKLDGSLQGLELYELRQASEAHSTGIILSDVADNTSTKRDFDTFFCQLILRQANFAVTRNCEEASTVEAEIYESVVEEIVSLFDTYLRYQGEDDKWDESGRAYFTERVRHFTSQGRRIELCLPAFPCKSSNTDKVTGKDPDRGELLALERLHDFVEAVEKIYHVGAKLWIISDGHVFSDCIGVDDQDVDLYGQKLISMNNAISFLRGNADRVGFKSLVDLFELEKGGSKISRIAELNIPGINHHVETRVTVEAELCRRILMAGCQSQRSALRARVDSQDAAILALYRGFSRFMLEDLELHPFTRAMTRSKQKKLSAKVAFEMIMRNQAYSNLVELLFPNHIRLSIHAHNNAGPKFGIQLFDPEVVRAVESLSPDSRLMTSRDLLHIPTPWHNSMVKIVGSKVMYLTKAKVVREALAGGGMTGSLLGRDGWHDPLAAVFFSLCTTTLGEVEGRKREVTKQHETMHTETQAATISQKVITAKEGIASLTISPIRYLAASSTALTCDTDYVFV
ncbi:Pyoverdine/dityrosine biosynthesis protein-domain-containing protein [Jackrogersella minutella]|nr:Pyoverdine/dityrosine biosynthesis protein-domain-containing protein [Jackrogersella minutella]